LIHEAVEKHRDEILKTYADLHAIPGVGVRRGPDQCLYSNRNWKTRKSAGGPGDGNRSGSCAVMASQPGLTVGLRADIDALPFQDKEGGTCYMHACGHDGHTTMGIWTLLLLQELQLVKKG
jgi:metal-dependent amidase/aminoacylase/carboxypeptidase family protein